MIKEWCCSISCDIETLTRNDARRDEGCHLKLSYHSRPQIGSTLSHKCVAFAVGARGNCVDGFGGKHSLLHCWRWIPGFLNQGHLPRLYYTPRPTLLVSPRFVFAVCASCFGVAVSIAMICFLLFVDNFRCLEIICFCLYPLLTRHVVNNTNLSVSKPVENLVLCIKNVSHWNSIVRWNTLNFIRLSFLNCSMQCYKPLSSHSAHQVQHWNFESYGGIRVKYFQYIFEKRYRIARKTIFRHDWSHRFPSWLLSLFYASQSKLVGTSVASWACTYSKGSDHRWCRCDTHTIFCLGAPSNKTSL